MTSSRRGIAALPLGAVEPATHDPHRFLAIAQPGIERHYRGIGVADHQLDLAYSVLPQPRLGGAHQPVSETAAPMRRIDRKIIGPPPMPVMTHHDATDDNALPVRH